MSLVNKKAPAAEDNAASPAISPHSTDHAALMKENEDLRNRLATANSYIRAKLNQLLAVMGTSPLRPEELDDESLIEMDPIGIVGASFGQILEHLHDTNDRLRIANEEVKAIFDSAGAGVLVIDEEMKVLAYNTKLKELFSVEAEEIIGRPCYDIVCRIDRLEDSCPFRKTFSTGEGFRQMEWALGDRIYDVIGTPLKQQGRVSRMVLVYVDVTERIKAGEALRESEERYRDLFENANDMIQCVGPDGSLVFVNRAWQEALGYSEDYLEDLSIFDVIHPECEEECSQEFKSVVYGEKTGRVETVFIDRGGRKIIVEGDVGRIFRGGRFVGTRGIFRDVTERREAERALASEKERLAVTLRSLGEGVITTDTEGRVVSLNRAAEMLTGWSEKEADGRSIAEVFPLSDRKTGKPCESPVDKVLRNGAVSEPDHHSMLTARDGTRHLIAGSGAPISNRESIIIGVVLVFRDITEKQQWEEKILKAEKIESLGVLAGGIAHDFNNLLTAILGNVELAAMSLTPDSEALKCLSRAEKAVVRARDLTNQLLTFSKGGAPIKKAASITEVIRDSADFAVRGSNVGCEFLLSADLWKVEIDEGQFSQVVNNLVINAVQAMPEGGKIRISAEKALISPPGLPSPGSDKYVKITVSDQGPGIPQEHISRIFDPYFTTKSTGSGLGLATTYSIIKSHGGFIDVTSETGKGTTFHIFLPAFDGDERDRGERQYNPPASHGTGRILLMDDDEMVKITVGNMLKRTGYEVTVARDGGEALRLYRDAMEANNPFLVVIMDLTVPGGMGGSETMQRLREIDPAARAIVSSGYSSDPVMANHRRYGFGAVLVKPYRKEQLAAAIQEALASR